MNRIIFSSLLYVKITWGLRASRSYESYLSNSGDYECQQRRWPHRSTCPSPPKMSKSNRSDSVVIEDEGVYKKAYDAIFLTYADPSDAKAVCSLIIITILNSMRKEAPREVIVFIIASSSRFVEDVFTNIISHFIFIPSIPSSAQNTISSTIIS